ncbi:MAG: hypothetical protein JO058_05680 [Alphaproteobacteria bacterium]|nr:hypothetical protein [Alphaproteobacteria bacterium]
MKRLPGGFLGFGNTFRALTMSPIQTLVDEANKMARRRLELGGATCGRQNLLPPAFPADFIVPADVDAGEPVRQSNDIWPSRVLNHPPMHRRC